MPKLHKDQLVEVKLDSAAGLVEAALSEEQRRDLFEHPGKTIVAIVELSSVQYTGHAGGEEKLPQVKLRATGCEVARTDEEQSSLLEAKRAMWRARRMDGTLDEIGNGPRRAEGVLDASFAGYPTEEEFRQAEREKEERRRAQYVR
ncbi:hypothetical protein [Streptomyces sp. NPDC059753]|uniref:hypothetical protein n=1 Tax=Streptomyces sp. NPDC059753 TaxID=3346933 RepID=UPI0036523AFF